jgi:hypothetical protein
METKRNHRFINRTGERIGFITITSLSDEKYINPNSKVEFLKWNYVCDCGKYGSAQYKHLNKAKIHKQSCGCNKGGSRETKLLYEQGLKKCTKCNEILPIHEFHNNKGTLLGLQNQCKKCKFTMDKNYRENPPKGRESFLERQKESYQKYKNNSPEKYNLFLEKRRGTRDYSQEYQRTISNEMLNAKYSIRHCIISSLKIRNITKSKLVMKTEDILGCKFEVFKEYLESQFEEGMNWLNHGKWHIDHKVPLYVGVTNDEIVKLNHYSNFQPLWATENMSKSKKMLEEHKNLHLDLLGRTYEE